MLRSKGLLARHSLGAEHLVVRLDSDQITILNAQRFETHDDEPAPRPTCQRKPKVTECGRWIDIELAIQFKKIDGRRLLLSPEGEDLVLPSKPEPKQHLVDAIGLAYRWHDDLLKTGQQIRAYAEGNRISRTRIVTLLTLVNLGPEVLRHVLTGTIAPSITLDDLLEAAKHLDWTHQSRVLGIDPASDAA